jgi:tetratricopeptide (TPR) repeat protein
MFEATLSKLKQGTRMQKLTLALLFTSLFASLSSPVFANPAEESIRPIQDQWAEIKYRVPEKQQAARYHALAEQAGQLAAAQPSHAEALIWQGIALSSEAGAKGGLGALSVAKAAKKQLEAAIKLNGDALNGSAYTSLGTLYFKVPGWPIGFGDKAKAEELLKKALAINPAGIDPNFFYADYLAGRERYAEALRHLETALKAAPRAGREVADSGRRQEIQALIAKVKKDME